MLSSKLLGPVVGLLFLASSSLQRTLQPLPLSSSDQWIIDASGSHVPFVGINWPGAADTMLPEGLNYQSIANIVDKITQTGFNVVRLTFAIELVDDILDNGGDVSLNDTLTRALGQENGTIVLNNILVNNPSFTAETTRLQVRSIFPHLELTPEGNHARGIDDFCRSSMRWRQGLQHRIFMSTWTITFQKQGGAAA